jgi:hypothetical protein
MPITFQSCISKAVTKALKDAEPPADTLANHAAHNAVLGASEDARKLTQALISGLKGVTDTLNPDIQRLWKVIDSLGSLSTDQLKKLTDTLQDRLARIKDEIKDPTLRKYLESLVDGLGNTLDRKTQILLRNAIATAAASLDSPAVKKRLSGLISGILNDSARQAAQLLVTGALQPTIDSIAGKIDGIVHKDVPFVQKWATQLIWTLAAVAALIIGLVWYQRTRYARLVQVLTNHINAMPSQPAYDSLTQSIQSQAQTENLEPLLRKTLKKQGINH